MKWKNTSHKTNSEKIFLYSDFSNQDLRVTICLHRICHRSAKLNWVSPPFSWTVLQGREYTFYRQSIEIMNSVFVMNLNLFLSNEVIPFKHLNQNVLFLTNFENQTSFTLRVIWSEQRLIQDTLVEILSLLKSAEKENWTSPHKLFVSYQVLILLIK